MMTSNLRILLAEDNEVNQHLMLRILSRIGYEATLATTGIQVLNKMDRQDYDVILMDIQMPEMDGITATRLIRAHYAPEKQPRIIALTAETSIDGKAKYLAVGMDDLLVKPVKVSDLVSILGRLTDEPLQDHEDQRTESKASSLSDFLTLDADVIDEFVNIMGDDGHESAIQLINLYKKGTPEIIEKIEKNAEKKNLAELLKLVHTLKGSSSQIGARRMEQLCTRLEVLLRQSGVEPFVTFISGIKQEYANLLAELDLFLASLN
jgi:CheY-like chemotaxis protein